MVRRKCTPKQLAALRRGREKLAHKRSRKTTNGKFRLDLEDKTSGITGAAAGRILAQGLLKKIQQRRS